MKESKNSTDTRPLLSKKEFTKLRVREVAEYHGFGQDYAAFKKAINDIDENFNWRYEKYVSVFTLIESPLVKALK